MRKKAVSDLSEKLLRINLSLSTPRKKDAWKKILKRGRKFVEDQTGLLISTEDIRIGI